MKITENTLKEALQKFANNTERNLTTILTRINNVSQRETANDFKRICYEFYEDVEFSVVHQPIQSYKRKKCQETYLVRLNFRNIKCTYNFKTSKHLSDALKQHYIEHVNFNFCNPFHCYMTLFAIHPIMDPKEWIDNLFNSKIMT